MKKENTLAILMGIFFGALLAIFVVKQAQQIKLNKNKTIAQKDNLTKSVSLDKEKKQDFIITNPSNNDLFKKSSVVIKGKAPKDSLIIIQSQIKELTLKNKDINFEINFPLAFGVNTVNISFYPNDKQLRPQEKQLKIYYLDNQL